MKCTSVNSRHWVVRYDVKEEFNVDAKGECDQLNPAQKKI